MKYIYLIIRHIFPKKKKLVSYRKIIDVCELKENDCVVGRLYVIKDNVGRLYVLQDNFGNIKHEKN